MTLTKRVWHRHVGGKSEQIDSSESDDGTSECLLKSKIAVDNCSSRWSDASYLSPFPSFKWINNSWAHKDSRTQYKLSMWTSPVVNKTYERWKVDDDESGWRERERNAELAWTRNVSQLLQQWGQCLTTVMTGSGSWLGTFLLRSLGRRQANGEKVLITDLSPLQEERLRNLQSRLQIPFDGTQLEHQEALKALWQVAFPDVELRGLISEQWKDMGWQGSDPSTDFRGGGFVSLENMLFLAKMFPKSFHKLLFKQAGKRATWEYPFAIAGINISFMLIQMLDLYSGIPKTPAGINFLKILAEDETAFDLLYCVAFEMIDAQWLAMHASYMEFNEVLKAARRQLERELSLEDINQIQDLPAYNLLHQ